MPYDYMGRPIDETTWQNAGSAGIAGALGRMQPGMMFPDLIAQGAAGYTAGRYGYLSDALEEQDRQKMMDWREQDRLAAEEERRRADEQAQREFELEQERIRYYQEQLPPGTSVPPGTDSAGLAGMLDEFNTEKASDERYQVIQQELTNRGIQPTGIPEVDLEQLESAVKPAPQMTPWQQYQQGRNAQQDAEEEQAEQDELDAAYRDSSMYRNLRGLPPSPEQQREQEERARAEQEQAAFQELLGDKATGVRDLDLPAAREVQKARTAPAGQGLAGMMGMMDENGEMPQADESFAEPPPQEQPPPPQPAPGPPPIQVPSPRAAPGVGGGLVPPKNAPKADRTSSPTQGPSPEPVKPPAGIAQVTGDSMKSFVSRVRVPEAMKSNPDFMMKAQADITRKVAAGMSRTQAEREVMAEIRASAERAGVWIGGS